MAPDPILAPVPHSAGVNRPVRTLPPLACDSHMHVFDARFAASPHWPRTPPDAPVAAYRRLQQRLGTARAVVVTPSTYGTDNACTLDALDQLGDGARGVAVVGEGATDAELDRLHACRVRGLRVNFVSPQSWGETTPAMLATLARKASRLGWHIQVFAHPEQIVALAPLLRTLPVPLVIDHLGRIDPAEGTCGPAWGVLRGLLDGGNTWVKLSGAYMRSTVHGAGRHADTLPLGRALVQAAPERLVWGSDWPHTTEAPGTVNDADLLDLLRDWAGSDAAMDGILVRNPALLYGFDADSPPPGAG
ncbi:amidohydrolase family protein [Paracidovorax konjaci]|uniref:Predicted metal-dependent hydrolase, TIM-barrel fold n=1 Tax=Paracidovorax konjaci TaxID=32040 RepID=A0A1I1U2C1_9BURK|nr:amidohydrolase family protein [Paracidovorax konjaci]SFD65006.1 Predicted metal-dependent hydrolase, TIM-barrel fold [Paracidovorax konjaci]